VTRKLGICKLTWNTKEAMTSADVLSSKELNDKPKLLEYLLDLSLHTMKLESTDMIYFSSSKSNSIDLLRHLNLNSQSNVENKIKQSSIEASESYRRLKSKKAYNEDKLAHVKGRILTDDERREESKKQSLDIIQKGKSTTSDTRVSVVGKLFVRRDKDVITAFVLNVGGLDINLDLEAIDQLCCGEEGRALFYKKNRHNDHQRAGSEIKRAKNKHGQKTSGKRIYCLAVIGETIGVRNFQRVTRQDIERSKMTKGELDATGYKKRVRDFEKVKDIEHTRAIVAEEERM
jgi:hypothetical protein